MSYDRYNRFRANGKVCVPFIPKIPSMPSDYFETYNRGTSRLDLISSDYYGSPDYDWLILMANPELPDLEFLIPNGSVLRIPFPLDIALENFNEQISRQDALYGINSSR